MKRIIRMVLPDEENANTSVVLRSNEAKIFFEIIKSSLSDSISVEIILTFR